MENFSPDFLKIMGFDSGLEEDNTLTRRLDYPFNTESSSTTEGNEAGKTIQVSGKGISGLRKNDFERNTMKAKTSQLQTEPQRFAERHRFEEFPSENLATPNLEPRGPVPLPFQWVYHEPKAEKNTEPLETDVTAFITNLMRNSHLSPSLETNSSDHCIPTNQTTPTKSYEPSKKLGQVESRLLSSDKLFPEFEGFQFDDKEAEESRQVAQVFDTYRSPSSNRRPLKISRLGRREGLDEARDRFGLHHTAEISTHTRRERESPVGSGLSLAHPSLSKKQESRHSPSCPLLIEQKGREETFQRLRNAPHVVTKKESPTNSPIASQLLHNPSELMIHPEPSLLEAISDVTIVSAKEEEEIRSHDRNWNRSEPEESNDNSLFTQLGCSDESSGSGPGTLASAAKHLSEKKKRGNFIRIRDLQMKSCVGETVHTSLWFGTNSHQSPHISCEILLSRFDAMSSTNSSPSADVIDPFRVAEGNKKEKVKNISEFVVSFQPSACGLYSAVLQFQSRKKTYMILIRGTATKREPPKTKTVTVKQSMTVIKRDEEARPQLKTPVLRMPSSLGDRSIYFSEKILDFGQTQIGTLYRLKATICNPCDTKDTFIFSDPEFPFAISHHEVTIPPRSYIRLPIRLVAISEGTFRSVLRAKSAHANVSIQLELTTSSHCILLP